MRSRPSPGSPRSADHSVAANQSTAVSSTRKTLIPSTPSWYRTPRSGIQDSSTACWSPEAPALEVRDQGDRQHERHERPEHPGPPRQPARQDEREAPASGAQSTLSTATPEQRAERRVQHQLLTTKK